MGNHRQTSQCQSHLYRNQRGLWRFGSRQQESLKQTPHFFVTSGDDEVAMPWLPAAVRCNLSHGQCLPLIFSGMIRAALAEDFVKARELNFQTYDLHKWLYVEGNPVGIKSAMEILGFVPMKWDCPGQNVWNQLYRSEESSGSSHPGPPRLSLVFLPWEVNRFYLRAGLST